MLDLNLCERMMNQKNGCESKHCKDEADLANPEEAMEG